MKIYIYDRETKEFLWEAVPQKHPKKEGEYLFPPNSTIIAPPEISSNKIVLFNGKFWDIEDDYRGELQINIVTKEISEISKWGKLDNNFILYSEYLKSDDYKSDLRKQELNNKKAEILAQIKQIDEKRIRAICEPSIKDEKSGLSWLDYYNSQMQELRSKLKEVLYDD